MRDRVSRRLIEQSGPGSNWGLSMTGDGKDALKRAISAACAGYFRKAKYFYRTDKYIALYWGRPSSVLNPTISPLSEDGILRAILDWYEQIDLAYPSVDYKGDGDIIQGWRLKAFSDLSDSPAPSSEYAILCVETAWTVYGK